MVRASVHTEHDMTTPVRENITVKKNGASKIINIKQAIIVKTLKNNKNYFSEIAMNIKFTDLFSIYFIC